MPTRLNIYGQTISTTKKRPCIAATTIDIALSGATTPTTIDGINIGIGDRVLVWQQNLPEKNGIYRVETSQLLTRDYDFNISDDLYTGIEVLILSGLTYSGKTFYLTTTGGITIDSTSLTFDILAGQNGTSGTSGGTGSSGTSGVSYNFQIQEYINENNNKLVFTAGTLPINYARTHVYQGGQKLYTSQYTIVTSAVTIDNITHYPGASYQIFAII